MATPYVTPGYTAGDVAAAGVIGFGAGIALGALAGGGCCGWGWNSWNCDWHGGAVVYNHNNFYGNTAWHGGYYNGGYHDGYGYHNAYNKTTVNNFHGSANRINNVNREDDRNLDANRAGSWSHDDSAFGRSNAFSGLGDRFGGLGGWSSRADSFRGWGSMRAGGFSGGRFGGGTSAALAVAVSTAAGSGVRRHALEGDLCRTYLRTTRFVIFALIDRRWSRVARPSSPPRKRRLPTAEKTVPKTFASPSEAGAALLAAAQSGDRSAWLEIFGPDGAEILFTGDPAQDGTNLRDFVIAYTRMNRWGQIKAGGQTLYIGPDNYAFPIPLGKDSSGRWYFDTAAGKDEMLARRIGKHELSAIAACEATASAQKHGQAASALGQLGDFGKVVASNAGDRPPLFNGYYYRIPAKGKTAGGFAVLAYPAEYRNSGIMTFIVGKDGAVYQKDLGEKTADVALAMTEFNPADGWSAAVPHSGTASRVQQ